MNQPQISQNDANMVDARHYTYRVEWSADDGEFVATVLEYPSLSWLDVDQAAALAGLVRLVERVIEDMTDNGETVPEPFGERRFSGQFMIRTTAAVHRRLTIEAAERHTSLNKVAIERLTKV